MVNRPQGDLSLLFQADLAGVSMPRVTSLVVESFFGLSRPRIVAKKKKQS